MRKVMQNTATTSAKTGNNSTPISLPIQTSLKIGTVNDPLEKEADDMADRIMRMTDTPVIQRKCTDCEEEGKINRKPLSSQITPFIQCKSDGNGVASVNVSSRIQSRRGRGNPLSTRTQNFMESRFGADFSGVRIHSGSEASRLSHDLNAKAFTVGRDVYFNQGQFAPETTSGKRLLAHELTHVVQQGRVDKKSIQSDANKSRRGHEIKSNLGKRSTRFIQKFGNPSAIPSGMSCPTNIATGRPTGTDLMYPSNNYTITPALRSQLSGVFIDWLAGGGIEEIVIHGYASVEGRQGYNWTLSCNRALSAQTELISMGIPANLISTLANGETTDFSTSHSPNRRVIIHKRTAISSTRGTDQRAAIRPGIAATLPSSGLAREIGYELDPSSRPPARPATPPSPTPAVPTPAAPTTPVPSTPTPTPARIPWDGRTGAVGAAAARTNMQTALFAAFDAYLTHFRARVLRTLGMSRVPFSTPVATTGVSRAPSGVVDIANQARSVLESRYSTSMDVATTSPAQQRQRSVRIASGSGQNIFDSSSEADRRILTGRTNLAPGIAWWLFENDVPGATGAAGSRQFASEILRAHHFSTQDPGATQFRWAVARAYAAASTLSPSNSRQLIDYRLTLLSERGNRGITLTSSFTPGRNPSQSELIKRWLIFNTAVHESLHLRAHPVFKTATMGRGTMNEGFVEMFTISTLNTDILPRVRAGNAEPLRNIVEGALALPSPDPVIIRNRNTPTQYVAHRAQAERIRDGGTPTGGTAHAGIGETAARAAFFQGHVEFLGLTPTGGQLTSLLTSGNASDVRIPGGISGLDDLARRSGVARSIITRDNPGITDALPARVILPGCREHWVLANETRALIAAQNGVSEADLVRANPDITVDPLTNAWPTLTAGHRLLIPVH